MKEVGEVNAVVFDYGSFLDLADSLADTYANVWYHSPREKEFRDVKECVIGKGLSKVKRVDEPLDPAFLKKIDLAIFPDIGFKGIQNLMLERGIAVWGSRAATDLELYRDKFLETIKELGLEVLPWVRIEGLTNLVEHLKGVKNKWVKVNEYRENMETWHHVDFAHSEDELTRLASEFGGYKEKVVFVVQDPLDADPDEPVMEIGYDGLSVDGDFPEQSFAGYEKKNELYLGSLRKYKQLPKEVRYVNNEIAPWLEENGYRNFLATEVRVKGKKICFIDPTFRLAGQTMEHYFETCPNLPEVIWKGANGILIVPEFTHQYAAEATLHYGAHHGGWKTIMVPKEAERWIKLYHYFATDEDDTYRFPPHKSDEVGVVIGLGNTVAKSIEHLKKNLEHLKNENISTRLGGFADLIKEIEEAENEGMEFSDKPLPSPEIAIAD